MGDPGGFEGAVSGRQKVRLPTWVSVIVVLSLTALLAYNIIFVGPEGLSTSYVLGGLLGAYTGVDQMLKRREGGDDGKRGGG